MALEFRCGHCRKLLSVPDGSEGKACECPRCNATLTVPSGATDRGQGGSSSVQNHGEQPKLDAERLEREGKIRIACPECAQYLECNMKLEGTKGFCQHCGAVFKISTGKMRTESILKGPIFLCPECKEVFQGSEEQEGKKGRCSSCRHVFTIELVELSSPKATGLASNRPLLVDKPPKPNTSVEKPKADITTSRSPSGWSNVELPLASTPSKTHDPFGDALGQVPNPYHSANQYTDATNFGYGTSQHAQVSFRQLMGLALDITVPGIFYCWGLIACYFAFIVAVYVCVFVVMLLVGMLPETLVESISPVVPIILMILGVVFFYVAQIVAQLYFFTGYYLLGLRAANKEPIEFGELLGRSDLILPIFGWSLVAAVGYGIVGMVVFLPTLVLVAVQANGPAYFILTPFVLGAIFLIFRFGPTLSLAPFGIVAEYGVSESIRRADELYRRNLFPMLGAFVVTALAAPVIAIFSLGLLSPFPLFVMAAAHKLGSKSIRNT